MPAKIRQSTITVILTSARQEDQGKQNSGNSTMNVKRRNELHKAREEGEEIRALARKQERDEWNRKIYGLRISDRGERSGQIIRTPTHIPNPSKSNHRIIYIQTSPPTSLLSTYDHLNSQSAAHAPALVKLFNSVTANTLLLAL